MYGDKILIVSGDFGYGQAVRGLGDIVDDNKDFIRNPKDYKLLLFTGGEDVSPELYGHTSPKRMCHNNYDRDAIEMHIYKIGLLNSIKMTGICRGSQFLNVMNGGYMMHHITNHGVPHSMKTAQGDTIQVTSTHHQMSVPTDEGHIIAWSATKRSTIYVGDKDEPVDYEGLETEALWYPQTGCAAVQYHPEDMPQNSSGYLWYNTLVYDLLRLSSTDFTKVYVMGQDRCDLKELEA